MRRRSIPSTLIISLQPFASDGEFETLLEDQSLFGTQVSSLTKKYAVEVPPGEEEKFKQFFEDCILVKYVSSEYIKGHRFKPPTPQNATLQNQS